MVVFNVFLTKYLAGAALPFAPSVTTENVDLWPIGLLRAAQSSGRYRGRSRHGANKSARTSCQPDCCQNSAQEGDSTGTIRQGVREQGELRQCTKWCRAHCFASYCLTAPCSVACKRARTSRSASPTVRISTAIQPMLDAGQDWGPSVPSRPHRYRPTTPKLQVPARSLSRINRDLNEQKGRDQLWIGLRT